MAVDVEAVRFLRGRSLGTDIDPRHSESITDGSIAAAERALHRARADLQDRAADLAAAESAPKEVCCEDGT